MATSITKFDKLPGWPLLMDQATACAYLSHSAAQLRSLISRGMMPPPREYLRGVKRWSRQEIDLYAARLWGVDPATEKAKERAKVEAAVAALAAGIRAGPQRRRKNVGADKKPT